LAKPNAGKEKPKKVDEKPKRLLLMKISDT
jgi:hypothetical protein